MNRILLPLVAFLLFIAVPKPIVDGSERPLGRAEVLYAEGSYDMAAAAFRREAATLAPGEAATLLLIKELDSQWRALAKEKPYYFVHSAQYEQIELKLDSIVRDTGFAAESLARIEGLYVLARLREFQGESDESAEAFHEAHRILVEAGRREEAARMLVRLASDPVPSDMHPFYGTRLIRSVVPMVEEALLHLSLEDRIALYLLRVQSAYRRHPYSNDYRQLLEGLEKKAVGTRWEERARELLVDVYTGGWREEVLIRYDHRSAVGLLEALVAGAKDERQLRRWSKELEALREPSVRVFGDTQHALGSQVSVELSIYQEEKVTVTLHRLDFEAQLKEPSVLFDIAQRRFDGEGEGEFVAEISISPEDSHDYRGFSVPLPQAKEPGTYIVKAVGLKGSFGSTILSISPFVAKLFSNGIDMQCMLVDGLTGRPVAGADVWLFDKNGEKETRSLGRGPTGENGMATFAGEINRWALAVYRVGETWGLSSEWENHEWYRANGRRTLAYLHADKPAYRPGETVRWQATLREWRDDKYEVPDRRSARLVIETDSDVFFDGVVDLDEMGRSSGELGLPAGAFLGEYQASLYWVDEDRSIADETLFAVVEYRLPEWDAQLRIVEIDEGQKLGPGDSAMIEVEARYLSGSPVASATVRVAVKCYPFRNAQNELSEKIQEEWPSQSFELLTDESGLARQMVWLPRFKGIGVEMSLSAEVTSRSHRTAELAKRVLILRTDGKLLFDTKSGFAAAGAEAELSFVAETHGGEPVAMRGSVLAERVEKWIRLVKGDGSVERITIGEWGRRFHGDPEFAISSGIHLVEQETVTAETLQFSWESGVDGRGRSRLRFRHPGFYTLHWKGEGRSYGDSYGTSEFWVYPAEEEMEDLPWSTGVKIVLSKTGGESGDRVEALVALPYAGCSYTLVEELGSMPRFELRQPRGMYELLEFEPSASYSDTLRVGALAQVFGSRSASSESIKIENPHRRLAIVLRFDQETYEPGQAGEIEVRITDAGGSPVESDFSLVLTDASIFQLYDEWIEEVHAFFYKDTFRRLMGVPEWRATSLAFNRLNRRGVSFDLLGLWRWPTAQAIEGFESGSGSSSALLGPYVMLSAASRYLESGTLSGSRLYDMGSGGESKGAHDFVDQMPLVGQYATGALSDAASSPHALERILARAKGRLGVRKDFRSTLVWEPIVRTDKEGVARVPFVFGDKVGRWRATARVITPDTRVGQVVETTTTTKTLVNRILAPRFLMEGDEAVLGGTLTNVGAESMELDAAFTLEGLESADARVDGAALVVEYDRLNLPGNGEIEVSAPVTARAVGDATLTLFSGGEQRFDAVQQVLPVHSYAFRQRLDRGFDLAAGVAETEFALAEEAMSGSIVASVQISAGYLPTLLDALPYLLDFPYGCTEQTVSRFAPLMVAKRVWEKLGIDAETAMRQINANREAGGLKVPTTVSQYPLTGYDSIVEDAVRRLGSMQLDDGNWGWWPGGTPDPHLTAYAVYGMALARDAGLEEDGFDWDDSSAIAYLYRFLEERANLDLSLEAWVLFSLCHTGPEGLSLDLLQGRARLLVENRVALSTHAKSLLALGMSKIGMAEEAMELIIEIEAKASRLSDRLAFWDVSSLGGSVDGSRIECTAFALRALMALKPGSPLVEPGARWLVHSMEAGRWTNTRDTAYAVLALLDCLPMGFQSLADETVMLELNGRPLGAFSVGGEDGRFARTTLALPRDAMEPGRNVLRVFRADGSLGTFDAWLAVEYEARAEMIASKGETIAVRREYFKLVEKDGETKRMPLGQDDRVEVRDRVETVVTIDAKQAVDYFMCEDWRIAGLEMEDPETGWSTVFRAGASSGGLRMYREARDERVACFVERLPAGVWEIRYVSRAETVGSFRALPCKVEAMYAQRIHANSGAGFMEIGGP